MKSYVSILQEVQASYRGSAKQAIILNSQSLLQIYFLKPVSLYLTPFFVWLRFTPNQVSFLGFLVGLAGCLLLASGPTSLAILGAWLYLLHRVLDHVDGNLARYSRQMSSYGQFLDDSLGAIIQMALFLSVGIGVYQQWRTGDVSAPDALSGNPGLALLAGALASSIWMVGRFIRLQHSSIFESAQVDRPAAAPAEDSLLWKRARALNGVVPVVRVIGLIVAAHTETLAIYLGFFVLYIPTAFVIQYVKLLLLAGRSHRSVGAPAIRNDPC